MPTSIRTCLITLMAFSVGAVAVAQSHAHVGITLDVLSVEQLSDKEAADRSPDFLGPNVAVRLRLSTGQHGISFYGWPNSAIPSGYEVELDGGRRVWLFGEGGTAKRSTSPGIDAVLFGSKGAWITLPPHSAVEWVELDSSLFAGKKHAYTAFIRDRAGDEEEVFSTEFTVPNQNKSPGAPGSGSR